MSKTVIIFFLIFYSFNMVKGKEFKLTLNECIKLAMQNHSLNKIGELQTELANIKYSSALSTFYPTFSITLSANWMNKKPQFVIPESTLKLDPQFVELQASSLAMSQLTLQGISADTIGQEQFYALFNQTKSQISDGTNSLTIPEESLDLIDRKTIGGGLNMTLPIYAQGKRFIMKDLYNVGRQKSILFKESMQLEIIYNVKRAYFLYQMIEEVESNILNLKSSLNISLEIINKIWEKGDDLSINKTDVLKHKMVNQQVEYALLEINKKKKQIISGLTIAIGLSLDDLVIPTEGFLKAPNYTPINIKDLTEKLIFFNTDLNQISKDLEINKEYIALAKSDYQPTVALVGSFSFLESENDVGAMQELDKGNVGLGLVVDIPLFSGFSTRKKINEAKLELEVTKQKYILFKDKALFELKNNIEDLNFCFQEMTLLNNSLKLAEGLLESETHVYQMDNKSDKWEDVIKSQIYLTMIQSQLVTKKFEIYMIKNTMSKSVGKKIKEPDESLE